MVHIVTIATVKRCRQKTGKSLFLALVIWDTVSMQVQKDGTKTLRGNGGSLKKKACVLGWLMSQSESWIEWP